MLRLDTRAATAVTPAFSPSKALLMQAKLGAESVAKIEILMRVDPSADWLPAGLWDPTKEKLFACNPFPFVMLKLTGNTEGELVQVWDNLEAETKASPTPSKLTKPLEDLIAPELAEAYRNAKNGADEMPEMIRTFGDKPRKPLFVEPIEEVDPPVSEPYDERPVAYAEPLEG